MRLDWEMETLVDQLTPDLDVEVASTVEATLLRHDNLLVRGEVRLRGRRVFVCVEVSKQ